MAGLKRTLPCLVLAGWVGAAAAQMLPAPSRTMYKCTANNVTSYSDKPCLGAERLVANPARGVSKLSGTERIGKDVRAYFGHDTRRIRGVPPSLQAEHG